VIKPERPRLEFFRQTPADLLERPPLASSLQSFESCLFLIGLDRFPHAFVSCVTSVESALKAGLRVPEGDRTTLEELLKRARRDVPAIEALPQDLVDRLRHTRNRIVHYGFSPQDDDLTAALTLEVGMPLLAAAYRGFFGFGLDEALVVEIGDLLRTTRIVFDRVRSEPNVRVSGCFDALGHSIRLGMRTAAASVADDAAAERGQNIGLRFEAARERRDRLERLLKPSYVFDCPICFAPGSLVCQLVDSQLAKGQVTIARAICAECDLMIPADVPRLADALCDGQLQQRGKEILREYGIPGSGL
jgi:transcription elongation factor Elf1